MVRQMGFEPTVSTLKVWRLNPLAYCLMSSFGGPGRIRTDVVSLLKRQVQCPLCHEPKLERPAGIERKTWSLSLVMIQAPSDYEPAALPLS